MDMKDLCEAALREDKHHIRTVLATVVHVQGHAYRKEGVSMILTEDRRHYGTISPGCLEDDLCARVQQTWDSEHVCIVEYDMRPKDDLSWGENIGCGGLLHILLEPVRGELLTLLKTIYNRLDAGEIVRLTRQFGAQDERVTYHLFSGHHQLEAHNSYGSGSPGLHATGQRSEAGLTLFNGGATEAYAINENQLEWIGEKVTGKEIVDPLATDLSKVNLHTATPTPPSFNIIDADRQSESVSQRSIADNAHRLILAHHENQAVEATADDTKTEKQYTFIRTYRPKPRLIVIGAGDDSRMVSTLAQAAGFEVTVGDWRPALCTAERFPGARCVSGFPQELYEMIRPSQGDYMLLMSHNFPREREWVELLQHCPYAYLGIMGSSTRTQRLLDGLPDYPNVHAPVGLAIGADGPDEIAISIAAELIAVKRGKQRSNREVAGYEHRRTRTGSR
ncbi:XdhC family protein [Paenibacillus sp. SGZ-1009]|uniref:XdhC family protein n=1 Tax=Paenibacillus campi TaxID=3106031 RepID=UPI002AFEF0F2|nr:XdhC family protein [Paenibacillus sp. SGZ-1009]